jgi:predicted molibdopterin-dependent oxidoreductase YjgC
VGRDAVGERKQILTTCNCCNNGCGVIVIVEDDAIVRICANPNSFSAIERCPQGLSYFQHRSCAGLAESCEAEGSERGA